MCQKLCRNSDTYRKTVDQKIYSSYGNSISAHYNFLGNKTEDYIYKNSLRSGVGHRYSNSDKIYMETFYINNEEEGIRKIYSDDGTKLEKEFDFKEGVMVAARYYKKGKVIKEEKFDFEKQKEMLRNIPSDNTQR